MTILINDIIVETMNMPINKFGYAIIRKFSAKNDV